MANIREDFGKDLSIGQTKVLSIAECDELVDHLEVIDYSITRYCDELSDTINLFNSDPTVQSFYRSGSYGKEVEVKLAEVRDAVQKYYNAITNGGLVPVTKRIIDEQRAILIQTKRNEG